MATQLTDPYRGYAFRVEISGIQIAAFSEATVPEVTVETVPYREGTDPPYKRPQSGLTSYGALTLKKGLTDGMDLYNWTQLVAQKGANASGAKKNISLILIDSTGTDRCRWNVINAWPTKYTPSGFNAANSEVMIESFELTMDYMTRVK